MKPEEAIDAARAAAEHKRSEYVYPRETLAEGKPPAAPDLVRLREWAVVEVSPDVLYSTRAAPLTWFKRLMFRLMRQYTTELEAQQTRFNVGVVAYLDSLERPERE